MWLVYPTPPQAAHLALQHQDNINIFTFITDQLHEHRNQLTWELVVQKKSVKRRWVEEHDILILRKFGLPLVAGGLDRLTGDLTLLSSSLAARSSSIASSS